MSSKNFNLAGLLNDLSGAYDLMTNPVGAMKTMLMNNPKYQQFQKIPEDVEKYVNANGGDPETAFRRFAEQNGVNADSFMGIVKNIFR
jgi:hypothetical protein